MAKENSYVKITRRNLIVGAIAGLSGLIIGGLIGSKAFPRNVTKTITETKTITNVMTTTLTETITVQPTLTPTPEIPENLKKKFQSLIPEATVFVPVKVNEEIYYYKALSPTGSLLGYVFETKAYAPTDKLSIYAAVDTSYRIIAIDVEAAPEASYIYNPKITTPEFENQFKGLTISDLALKPNGKIDAVTGATISSQRVVDAVKEKINQIKSYQ